LPLLFLWGAKNLASTTIHKVTADMPITKKIRGDLILIRKISSAMAKRIVAIVIITSQRCIKSILESLHHFMAIPYLM
jgi:hypothetical protein